MLKRFFWKEQIEVKEQVEAKVTVFYFTLDVWKCWEKEEHQKFIHSKLNWLFNPFNVCFSFLFVDKIKLTYFINTKLQNRVIQGLITIRSMKL